MRLVSGFRYSHRSPHSLWLLSRRPSARGDRCFAVYISWITHLAAPDETTPAAAEETDEPFDATVGVAGAASVREQAQIVRGHEPPPLPEIVISDRKVNLVTGEPNYTRGAPIKELEEAREAAQGQRQPDESRGGLRAA